MIKIELTLAHYRYCESKKEQIADLNADVAEAHKGFAKEHDIAVKSVTDDYKKYQAYHTNKQKFLDIELETDALTQSWCVELRAEVTEVK